MFRELGALVEKSDPVSRRKGDMSTSPVPSSPLKPPVHPVTAAQKSRMEPSLDLKLGSLDLRRGSSIDYSPDVKLKQSGALESLVDMSRQNRLMLDMRLKLQSDPIHNQPGNISSARMVRLEDSRIESQREGAGQQECPDAEDAAESD